MDDGSLSDTNALFSASDSSLSSILSHSLHAVLFLKCVHDLQEGIPCPSWACRSPGRTAGKKSPVRICLRGHMSVSRLSGCLTVSPVCPPVRLAGWSSGWLTGLLALLISRAQGARSRGSFAGRFVCEFATAGLPVRPGGSTKQGHAYLNFFLSCLAVARPARLPAHLDYESCEHGRPRGASCLESPGHCCPVGELHAGPADLQPDLWLRRPFFPGPVPVLVCAIPRPCSRRPALLCCLHGRSHLEDPGHLVVCPLLIEVLG